MLSCTSPVPPSGARGPAPLPPPAAGPGGAGQSEENAIAAERAGPARAAPLTLGGTYTGLHLRGNAFLRSLEVCPVREPGPGCPR